MSALDKKIAALKAEHGTGPKQVNGKKVAKKRVKKITPKRVATRPNKAAEQATLFAHAYVRHGCNATAAYKEISPNCKPESAQVLGHKMLRKVIVQQVLAPLLEALMQKNEVDTEFVLSRILEASNASPLDYFAIRNDGMLGALDLSAVTDAQRRNLKSIRVTKTTTISEHGNECINESFTVTVVDQQKAIDMFARYLQLYIKADERESDERIGDLIELGVKRIRKHKSLQAGIDAIEGVFSEVESR